MSAILPRSISHFIDATAIAYDDRRRGPQYQGIGAKILRSTAVPIA